MSQISYWNNYYLERSSHLYPSQFAAFIADEFKSCGSFVDLGCGNGRDTFFFANFGRRVLGVDGSQIAISRCQEFAAELGKVDVNFEVLNFNDTDACKKFSISCKGQWENSVFYSRFFLHAIDEDAEYNFFSTVKSIMGEEGVLCLEFRTTRDADLAKVTNEHYRRYINPALLLGSLSEFELKCDYFCEGFGYAKYKNDDAYVARMIISHD